MATPDLSRFGAVLRAVSDSDTAGREQIEYIDIDLLDGDPRNFYALPNIAELAENILLVGLQQPLRVRAAENGRFVVTTGHRRRQALLKLVEQGYDQFRQVPCIREPEGESRAMTELRLICGNKDNRVRNGAELAREAERMESILLQLKKEGYEFQGKTRELVAELLQVSETKLANAKAIKNGIKVPGIAQKWAQNEIPEAAALEIARMDQAEQYQLLDWIIEKHRQYTIKEVRMFQTIWTCCKHDCPECGTLCPNAEDMYHAHYKAGSWNCAGCCLNCRDRDFCPTRCRYVPKSQAILDFEAQRAAREAAREAEARNQADQTDEYNRQIWMRLGEVARRQSVPAQTMLTLLDLEPMAGHTETYLKDLETAYSGNEQNESYMPENPLDGMSIQAVVHLLDALHISADYLLGRSEGSEGIPCGEWQRLDEEHWPAEGQLVILCYQNGLGGDCYLAAHCVGGFADQYPFLEAEFGTNADAVSGGEYEGVLWMPLPSKQQAEFPPNWWLRLPPEPEKGETT